MQFMANFHRPDDTDTGVREISVVLEAPDVTSAGHMVAVLQTHCLAWPGLVLESWGVIPDAETVSVSTGIPVA